MREAGQMTRLIHVTPMSGLREILQSCGTVRLISLLSPGAQFERPPGISRTDHLHLTMNDITAPSNGLVAPRADQVLQLCNFVLAGDPKAPIIVHCLAGISRSPAAAFVAAATLMPHRDEAELATELRRLSPWATPNFLIVDFADKLLERSGRMTAAIRAIGRGADAYEGKPFVIRTAGCGT